MKGKFVNLKPEDFSSNALEAINYICIKFGYKTSKPAVQLILDHYLTLQKQLDQKNQDLTKAERLIEYHCRLADEMDNYKLHLSQQHKKMKEFIDRHDLELHEEE